MGTITARKRKDGSIGYTAIVRIKRQGKIVHQEIETFEREKAATIWMKARETELAKKEVLDAILNPPTDPTLSEVITKYLTESVRDYGKTKRQVLASIQAHSIGSLRCSEIGSQQIVAFAQSIGSQPQTVGNYLAHLASVFAIAKPAWGYQLDKQAIDDARLVCQRMSITSRSNSRTRRPTIDELNKLMAHFGISKYKRVDTIPMQDMILFAIFSTRRLAEITRLTFEDFNEEHSEIWVRDMKHPGEKIGNDVMTILPPEAKAMILKYRKDKDQTGVIFPFNERTMSSLFTRACHVLGIEDLHFHDLRHDGVSRLFELGWAIPNVSQVSGHRTWTSLKRYTHIRQTGDKYANWEWLDTMGIKAHVPVQKAA